MSRPSPIALGLVGCGRVAELAYVPAIARVPAVRLVAVADPDAQRRQGVAAAAGAARRGVVSEFADAAGLLDGASVDAVILATPPQIRLAEASMATDAGVAVLVEKPPALDAVRAAELAALDPLPWVGFNRRFDPGAAQVRAAVAGRSDVELRLAIRYRRGAWGAYSVRNDALIDLGPHLIDWARWITGRDVLAVTTRSLTPTRAELELHLDGAKAVLSAATDQVHHESIEARDSSGRRLARHRVGGLAAALRARLGRGPESSALVDSFAGQLADLAAAVRGEDRPRLATALDGLAAMEVVDAARASAAAGGPISVAPPQTDDADDRSRPGRS